MNSCGGPPVGRRLPCSGSWRGGESWLSEDARPALGGEGCGHGVVVHIEGASYRLRRHVDLIQDSARARPSNPAVTAPRRRDDPQSSDRLNSPRLPDLTVR